MIASTPKTVMTLPNTARIMEAGLVRRSTYWGAAIGVGESGFPVRGPPADTAGTTDAGCIAGFVPVCPRRTMTASAKTHTTATAIAAPGAKGNSPRKKNGQKHDANMELVRDGRSDLDRRAVDEPDHDRRRSLRRWHLNGLARRSPGLPMAKPALPRVGRIDGVAFGTDYFVRQGGLSVLACVRRIGLGAVEKAGHAPRRIINCRVCGRTAWCQSRFSKCCYGFSTNSAAVPCARIFSTDC
jgi:hypothetical protein